MKIFIFFSLLIFFLDSASIKYDKLVYQQEIKSHIPQCIIKHQVVNGVEEQYVRLEMKRFKQQMLPEGYPETEVFGFGCEAEDSVTKERLGMVYGSPGPTVKVTSGKRLAIEYVNNIQGNHLFQIDKSLITDPYKEINVSEIIGVPVVIHAHGMMVSSTSDGYPGAYVTYNGIKGPHYSTER
jgi:hypothetical protein